MAADPTPDEDAKGRQNAPETDYDVILEELPDASSPASPPPASPGAGSSAGSTASGAAGAGPGGLPWPVVLGAAAGGVAIVSSAAYLLALAYAQWLATVFVMLAFCAAFAAGAWGTYSYHVIGVPVGSTAYGLTVASIGVALVHAIGLIFVPLFAVLMVNLCKVPSCGGCGDCGCGQCCSDPSPCCGCGDACCGGGSSSGSSSGGGGCCGGGCCLTSFAGDNAAQPDANPSAGWRERVSQRFAHHPNTDQFRADVYHVFGVRLCIGCFTTFPLFVGASLVLAFLPVPGPWWAWLAAGLGLALAQALSAMGWTQTKARKILVKVALGLGTGFLLHGIRTAPLVDPVKVALVLGAIGFAWLSTVPRTDRMRAYTQTQVPGNA